MTEDPVPLIKDHEPPQGAAASRSRPDIVIRLPHLEFPVDPKPNPRP
jgi:hypothetical protein